jgi:hypothetical protein
MESPTSFKIEVKKKTGQFCKSGTNNWFVTATKGVFEVEISFWQIWLMGL